MTIKDLPEASYLLADKGGLGSKLHAVCDGLGRPVRLLLAAGSVSDIVGAGELLKDLQDSGEPKKGSLPRATSAEPKEDLAANCTPL
ncbi:MAG: hypothetical protein LBF42_04075 [Puniceicoccales bacterium]|nr:hypothetical protein [Puniceicoccales bacterium]